MMVVGAVVVVEVVVVEVLVVVEVVVITVEVVVVVVDVVVEVFVAGKVTGSVTFITAGTISAIGFALLVLMLEDALVVEVFVVEVILVVDGGALVDVVEVTKLMVKNRRIAWTDVGDENLLMTTKILVTILDVNDICLNFVTKMSI